MADRKDTTKRWLLQKENELRIETKEQISVKVMFLLVIRVVCVVIVCVLSDNFMESLGSEECKCLFVLKWTSMRDGKS